MTPKAGEILVNIIAPKIRAAITRSGCRKYGAEDSEELIADCIAMAAKRLHRMKGRHQQMPPKLLAHYVLKNIRCGERFHGQGRSDAMASRTQWEERSSLVSLDAQPRSDDSDYKATFYNSLASKGDDPAITAGRRLDWAEIMKGTKDSHIDVICSLVDGRNGPEVAKAHGLTQWWVQRVKDRIRRKFRTLFKDELIRDAQLVPLWKKHVNAYRERTTCRAERTCA